MLPDLAESAFEQRAPISVAMYHQMIDGGVLPEKRSVELIEGVLVAVSPRSPAHVHALRVLNRLFCRALDDNWVVLPGGPMTLARSEPEPDLVVVRREVYEQAARHVSTASLVIEVAKSSLRLDRTLAAVYAEAGVPDYWVVNVEGRQVEVYPPREVSDPGRAGAAEVCSVYRAPSMLSPVAIPDVMVPVGSLFREE